MELPPTVFVAFGVITAAVLTGVFTLVNLIIAKEQKTSEFRQDWINELRTEVTIFISSVSIVTNYLILINEQANGYVEFNKRIDDFYKSNMELPIDIKKRYSSIILRLNPKDDKVLLEKLTNLNNLTSTKNIPKSIDVVTVASNELIEESQKLLKKEWKRVKRGEFAFYITKWLALIALIVIIGFGLYYHEQISSILTSLLILGE